MITMVMANKWNMIAEEKKEDVILNIKFTPTYDEEHGFYIYMVDDVELAYNNIEVSFDGETYELQAVIEDDEYTYYSSNTPFMLQGVESVNYMMIATMSGGEHAISIKVVSIAPTPPTPTGTIDINANGVYNVFSYAEAVVSIAGYQLMPVDMGENHDFGTYLDENGYGTITISNDCGYGITKRNIVLQYPFTDNGFVYPSISWVSDDGNNVTIEYYYNLNSITHASTTFKVYVLKPLNRGDYE